MVRSRRLLRCGKAMVFAIARRTRKRRGDGGLSPGQVTWQTIRGESRDLCYRLRLAYTFTVIFRQLRMLSDLVQLQVVSAIVRERTSLFLTVTKFSDLQENFPLQIGLFFFHCLDNCIYLFSGSRIMS